MSVRLRIVNATGFAGADGKEWNLLDGPAPAVMANGIGADWIHNHHVEIVEDGKMPKVTPGKPQYRVPLVSEFMAAPRNGLKAVSTFAGAGGSSTGYRIAGFDVLWVNEYDAHAASCYRANYPQTKVDQRDIRTVKPEEILAAIGMKAGELDVLDGSPPCFGRGTSVVTVRGTIPIEDVVIGDVVLTHRGRWRKVVGTMSRKGMTIRIDRRTVATPDHRYFVRSDERVLPGFRRADLCAGSYLAIPSSVEGCAIPDVPDGFADGADFWYMVGRWLADGWVRIEDGDPTAPLSSRPAPSSELTTCRACGAPGAVNARMKGRFFNSYCSTACCRKHKQSRRRRPRAAVLICAGRHKADALGRALDLLGVAVGRSEERTCSRFAISRTSLARWLVEHFGHESARKTIPGWALALRKEARDGILRGYLDGDGHAVKWGWTATSVSRNLIVGIGLLASGTGFSVNWGAGAKRGVATIEGRMVRTRKSWTVAISTDRIFSFRDGVHVWRKLRRPIERLGMRTVYDLTVEEDHSFIADGFAVHNCQSFSTAGKRQMGDPRSDLFFEYARLLRGLMPRAFVAENVSGMTRGVAQGMFKMVMAELESCGYAVQARMLDAQWLGVPQMRKRVIFVGFRRDIGLDPARAFPRPLPYRYSVAEACPWIVRVGRAVHFDTFSESGRDPGATMVPADSQPSGTIVASGPHMGNGFVEAPSIGPGKVIHSNAPYEQDRGDITGEPAPTIGTTHSGRFHIEGGGRPPESIEGTAIGREAENLGPGDQSDKYFSLVRAHPDEPCPTVTALGGERGVAGVIHPVERRKFTIAELKRIGSFPDDYVLIGPYSLQWKVIGNSVPPLMMAKVAAGVRDVFLGIQAQPAASTEA